MVSLRACTYSVECKRSPSSELKYLMVLEEEEPKARGCVVLRACRILEAILKLLMLVRGFILYVITVYMAACSALPVGLFDAGHWPIR